MRKATTMPMRDAAGDAQRKRELAAIHTAAAKLGLDTTSKDPGSEYRTILKTQAGVLSAADATPSGRRQVLAYMQAQAAPNGRWQGRQGWQIERLWEELGKLRALTDPTPAGLAAFLRAKHGVDLLRALDSVQGQQVIEALKAWKRRAERKQA